VSDDSKPLNQFSVTLLSVLLAAGEWYENPGQLYRAGQILEEVLPDVPPEPRMVPQFTASGVEIPPGLEATAAYRALHKAWAIMPAPWKRTPTPKEIATIIACVKKFTDAKKLGGSIYLRPLLNLAALKPED
jgi:hypothetical protein